VGIAAAGAVLLIAVLIWNPGRGAGIAPALFGPALRGEASYYHDGLAGRPTASGEAYDPQAMTAAHKTLPLGTRVRVERRDKDLSVTVRINDRGPFVEGRIIDLSRAAARQLKMTEEGVAPVRVYVLERPGA
jgi:rare lipoprotein A